MRQLPEVDVVIAVHDEARPIERATASALRNARSVRVTIVAHGIDEASVAGRVGALASDERVRILELRDGIASPAGPFNLGLDAATARFTSVLGSDDELEPGAIDSWLALADRSGADAVIARLRHAGGRAVPTPPARPLRSRRLHPVRDRLAYRSAPLGLVSREHFGDVRFAVGLPSGEDLPYVTRVWYSGRPLAYDRRGPAYLIHGGAGRVTQTARAIAAEFEAVDTVITDPAFAGLPRAAQHSLVVKLVRVQLFGAVSNRSSTDSWTFAERTALADAARRLLAAAPGADGVLSRADRALLDAILDDRVPTARLIDLSHRRRRRVSFNALVPRDVRRVLAVDGPLRFSAASALALR